MQISSLHYIVCGSVVHVTLKPKDAHHRCLFEREREKYFFVHGELLGKALQRVVTALSFSISLPSH